MSLTDIYVLDRAVATNFLHELQHRRDVAKPTFKPKLEKARSELKAFNEQELPKIAQAQQDPPTSLAVLLDRLQQLKLRALEPMNSETRITVSRDVMRLQDEVSKWKDRLSEGEIALELLRQKIFKDAVDRSEKAERDGQNLWYYVGRKDIPPAIAKTAADVDGKFSITIPHRSVVLFAYSDREIKDETQTYCWLVTPNPTDQLIMLTNKNTIDTTAPENFATHQ